MSEVKFAAGTAEGAPGEPKALYRTLSQKSTFAAQKEKNAEKRNKCCNAPQCKNCFTKKFWIGSTQNSLPLYDAEISIFATIFAWKGTVLPMVLTKPLFWFQIILHVSFYVLEMHVYPAFDTVDLEPLTWSTLTIPSSLVVFFIVFYSSQCYTRFFDLYKACVGMGGETMCWVALIKLHLTDDPAVRWNCVRFLLAAQHWVMYTLRPGGKVTDEEWDIIQERHLLSYEECVKVRGYQGFAPLLLITWSLNEVKQEMATDSEVHFQTSLVWDEFTEIAFKLRGHLSSLLNVMKQPVPWPYFHLLNLMVLLVLTLVAYGLVGLGHVALTTTVHAVICTIFIGLKNLSVALSDPFGDDTTDFQVEVFLGGSYKNALAHLKDEYITYGHKVPDGLHNPLVDGDMAYKERDKLSVDHSFLAMAGGAVGGAFGAVKDGVGAVKDGAMAGVDATKKAATETTGLLNRGKKEDDQ